MRVDDDTVTDVVEVLLVEELDVPVGASEEDFEACDERVPVTVYLRERDKADERDIVGEFDLLGVAVV